MKPSARDCARPTVRGHTKSFSGGCLLPSKWLLKRGAKEQNQTPEKGERDHSCTESIKLRKSRTMTCRLQLLAPSMMK